MSDAITKLIDRRLEIKLQLDRLEEELKAIDADLKDEYGIGEILLGSQGYGYRVGGTKKVTFLSPALQILKRYDVFEELCSPSMAKLEKLCKAGKLPWAEMDNIKGHTVETETPTLVKYIPEEAKVFG